MEGQPADMQQAVAMIQGLQQQVANLQAAGNQLTEQHAQQLAALQGELQNMHQQAQALQTRVKPAVPTPVFLGTAVQVRNMSGWIYSLRNNLLTQGITEPQLQVRHAVSLLGPVPLAWYMQLAPDPEDMPFATLDEFIAALRLAFPVTMQAAEARAKLYTARMAQGANFHIFLQQFVDIASQVPDLHPEEKLQALLMAVTPKLREALCDGHPTTFEAKALRLSGAQSRMLLLSA